MSHGPGLFWELEKQLSVDSMVVGDEQKVHIGKARKRQPKIIVSIQSNLRNLKILSRDRQHNRIQVVN